MLDSLLELLTSVVVEPVFPDVATVPGAAEMPDQSHLKFGGQTFTAAMSALSLTFSGFQGILLRLKEATASDLSGTRRKAA